MNLYQELAARLNVPESKIVPRLLQMVADETDAKILLALPANAPELAAKLGLSTQETESRLHELYLRGVAFPSKKTSPTVYRYAKAVVQLHDTTIQWKKAPKAFLDLWQEWVETEHLEMSIEMAKHDKDKKPPNRILSANIWIEPTTNVMAFDSIKEIVNKASSLAVLPCACRIKTKKCNHPLEVCIVLDKSADYNIERGTGRKIDAKEALEIFKKCEEDGLVHLTGTNSQDDIGHLLCNCCPCCCMILPLMMQGLPIQDPSRFRAEIDQEMCNGCGICHDRCYFGAIKWGEKEAVSVIIGEKCMGCGLCQVKCPVDAIKMVEARGKDFVPKHGSSFY